MVGRRLSWRRLLYLASGAPLGVAWFALLVTGWSLTIGLAVTPLVVPAVYGLAELTRACAAVEAALARWLLGVDAHAPGRAPRRSGWGLALGPVTDGGFWRAQAYLWLRATAGFALGVLVITALGVALGSIAAPFYAHAVTHGLDYGVYRPRDFVQALPLVPLGVCLLAVTLLLVIPLAQPFRSGAQSLLAEGATGAVPRGIPGRALAIHAWSAGLPCVVVTLIWVLAGAGGFWPIWVILPLAASLCVHAWVQELRRRPSWWRRPRMSFALAVHGGVFLALALFLLGVWAAAGGGSPWPLWPIMALAAVLAIHFAVVLLAAPGQAELSERIDVLTSTRAGAVDAQDARLRRIERDLHDGAQARLVALGMSLGMAERKLDEAQPGAARELLAEARAGAEQALRELRDLARGIHPPLLADRGLEAAVRSLADLSPLPVGLSVNMPERPPSQVESAAYFVLAEGLANAAKHARAGRVDIRIERAGPMLRLRIADDGVGGADPGGSGLVGLRHRVEALDGTFAVTSPRGGPTTLSAELPCGS